MIEGADRRLGEWVHSLLPDTDISFEAPSSELKAGVDLYLFELAEMMPNRGFTGTYLQLSLHYLVTAWAQSEDKAHKLLGSVVAAALKEKEFEVDFDVSRVAWQAV